MLIWACSVHCDRQLDLVNSCDQLCHHEQPSNRDQPCFFGTFTIAKEEVRWHHPVVHRPAGEE